MGESEISADTCVSSTALFLHLHARLPPHAVSSVQNTLLELQTPIHSLPLPPLEAVIKISQQGHFSHFGVPITFCRQFYHSFNQCLLSVYYVPGVLRPSDIGMNKMSTNPSPYSAYVLVSQTRLLE